MEKIPEDKQPEVGLKREVVNYGSLWKDDKGWLYNVDSDNGPLVPTVILRNETREMMRVSENSNVWRDMTKGFLYVEQPNGAFVLVKSGEPLKKKNHG